MRRLKPTGVIQFQGKTYKLYLYYNRVLDAFDILHRNDLEDYDKIELSVALFTNWHWRVLQLKPQHLLELYQTIFKKHIELQHNRKSSKPQQRLVDFRFDFDLIFGSFKRAYGIDLIKERERLDWYRFITLFQGLPQDTKIREVMNIRGREIPRRTKYNAKEIQNLMELKQYWALPCDRLENNYHEQLGVLFDNLKRMSKG